MDFEDIQHAIHAPSLISSPRNIEHFEACLHDELEPIASKLPLYVCCKAGSCETGSLTVEEVQISDSTPDFTKGSAIVEFMEYDSSHFTDGWRRAQLSFEFEWETATLTVRCRDPRLESEG